MELVEVHPQVDLAERQVDRETQCVELPDVLRVVEVGVVVVRQTRIPPGVLEAVVVLAA